jgi:cyanophycin synthetase
VGGVGVTQQQISNLQNRIIIQKAKEMGIKCTPLLADCEDFLELSYKDKTIIINKTRSHQLLLISGLLAQNKEATNKLLARNQLPISDFIIVEDIGEQSIQFLASHETVVVKPINAKCSLGVTIGIKTVEELEQAAIVAKEYSQKILIQKYVPGYDYRVLVIDGELIGVLEYRSAFIEGDGYSTIRQLIGHLNEKQLKKNTLEKPQSYQAIEPESLGLKSILQRKGLTLEDVLVNGQQLDLFSDENMLVTEFFDVITDRTADICPENIEMAIRAAKALQIDVAGIDIRCLHIDKPLDQTNGVILEVNALPDMVDPSIYFKKSTKDAAESYLTYLLDIEKE